MANNYPKIESTETPETPCILHVHQTKDNLQFNCIVTNQTLTRIFTESNSLYIPNFQN